MPRDIHLLRSLLLALDNSTEHHHDSLPLAQLLGSDYDTIEHYLHVLQDMRLATKSQDFRWRATSQGYDAASLLHDEDAWLKALQTAGGVPHFARLLAMLEQGRFGA